MIPHQVQLRLKSSFPDLGMPWQSCSAWQTSGNAVATGKKLSCPNFQQAQPEQQQPPQPPQPVAQAPHPPHHQLAPQPVDTAPTACGHSPHSLLHHSSSWLHSLYPVSTAAGSTACCTGTSTAAGSTGPPELCIGMASCSCAFLHHTTWPSFRQKGIAFWLLQGPTMSPFIRSLFHWAAMPRQFCS